MKKFTVISLTGLALALSIVGCNSSSSSSLEFENSSNVAISSFKLCKDDSILANLDTVFFSIDLDKGHIFNADSLPYGTKTDKLVPSVVTYGGASMMTLTEHRANGTDTVYDITEGCTDSINFENGPVMLDVTSVSGTVKKRYTIDVNVHKVVSDSLAWDRTAFTKLPSALASPKAQRTARTSKGAYCLTSDGSAFSLAFSANPDNAASWNISSVSLPAQADISSFAGTTDELFIIAGGILHKSTDGKAWTSTGVHMHAVYGAYGSELLGSVKSAGKWCTISYPSATTPVPAPAGMPVEASSLPVVYSSQMGLTPQAVIIGGRDADGSLCADAWGYDGKTWAKISTKPLPKALQGMVLVPFYVYHTNDIYITTEFSVMLAFGGNDGKENNRDVYISYYQGLDWTKAQDYLQLPSFIPALADAQAFVFDTTMYPASRAASSWIEMPLHNRIPAGVAIIPPAMADPNGAALRATRPITEWECPFIYLFGGVDNNGTLSNTLWRGTLNRLQFEPIQ